MDTELLEELTLKALSMLDLSEEKYEKMALFVEMAYDETLDHCHISELPDALKFTLVQMAAYKYNSALGAGLNSASYSGVSENYMQEYPQFITTSLNRYRVGGIL